MRDRSFPSSSPSSALLRYEELVARALMAEDPAAAFEEASRDPDLTPELQNLFAQADPNGVRISALLIARLRFERLIQGSTRARDWFAGNPEEFTHCFRRYHYAVPARALHPRDEAVAFEAWL